MYSDFNFHLQLSQDQIPKNEFIAIRDNNIEGNFLIHHFISYYLKNHGNVLLVGMAQTLTHYTYAGQKLNVNIKEAMDDKRFHFFNGMDWLISAPSNLEGNKNCISESGGSSYHMKDLYKLLDSLKPRKPGVIIIDDISMLLNVGYPLQQVLDFIHYCKVLSSKHNISFLGLYHGDDNELDEDYVLLHHSLCQYSTLNIDVSSLKTGYSRELSGEVLITKHSKTKFPLPKRLHFKLYDKDVKFLAPGTSSAVL